MPIPTASLTLEMPIDLSTLVQTLDLSVPDAEEYEKTPPFRTITLGQLIAETLIAQADQGGMILAVTRATMRDVTEQEIRNYARERIRMAGHSEPGDATRADLTLMAMVETEIHRQLTDPGDGAVTRGQPTPVIAAIVATEVRNQLSSYTSTVVAEIRDAALREIADHGRSHEDPIPPGG